MHIVGNDPEFEAEVLALRAALQDVYKERYAEANRAVQNGKAEASILLVPMGIVRPDEFDPEFYETKS